MSSQANLFDCLDDNCDVGSPYRNLGVRSGGGPRETCRAAENVSQGSQETRRESDPCASQ